MREVGVDFAWSSLRCIDKIFISRFASRHHPFSHFSSIPHPSILCHSIFEPLYSLPSPLHKHSFYLTFWSTETLIRSFEKVPSVCSRLLHFPLYIGQKLIDKSFICQTATSVLFFVNVHVFIWNTDFFLGII